MTHAPPDPAHGPGPISTAVRRAGKGLYNAREGRQGHGTDGAGTCLQDGRGAAGRGPGHRVAEAEVLR